MGPSAKQRNRGQGLPLLRCLQVECFDTPQPSLAISTPQGSPCCVESIHGQGSRMLLLAASTQLYCSRLMGWQERLRTLQVSGPGGQQQ